MKHKVCASFLRVLEGKGILLKCIQCCSRLEALVGFYLELSCSSLAASSEPVVFLLYGLICYLDHPAQGHRGTAQAGSKRRALEGAPTNNWSTLGSHSQMSRCVKVRQGAVECHDFQTSQVFSRC